MEEPEEEIKFTGVEEGDLFEKKFEKHEEVGKGRFGIVYRVVEKDKNKRRAAKFVKCLKSKEKEKVFSLSFHYRYANQHFSKYCFYFFI